MYNGIFDWNNKNSITELQRFINATQQTQQSYSLRAHFSLLATALENIQPTSYPIGALIFISDTSDSALQGADQIFSRLGNVKITFVLLGQGLDQSKLTQFSNNFINWTDLSQPQPPGWNNDVAAASYGCKL
uniref:VWFA domain-containing protein n=1 Tax=Panagrolaimus superbus TaxID=310955 RepID=A0A914YIE9_9BILA